MSSSLRITRSRYIEFGDWIKTIRRIFELYSNKHTKFQDLSIYDLDHSCRSDEKQTSSLSNDGATLKRVSIILERLNILHDDPIHTIVFVDDRTRNIIYDDLMERCRIILNDVRQFRSLIPKLEFFKIITKYECLFNDLNIDNFKNSCELNYQHDSIEFGCRGSKLYTSVVNDTDLNIDLRKLFI